MARRFSRKLSCLAGLLALTSACSEGASDDDLGLTFDASQVQPGRVDASVSALDGAAAWDGVGNDTSLDAASGDAATQNRDASADATSPRDANPGSDARTSDDGSAQGLSALSAPLPSGKEYSGWTWVDVPGSRCRDGSGAGYYWRRGKTDSLMVYLNGGGACADPFFCGLNPVNVDQDLPLEFLIFGTGNLVWGPDWIRQTAPDQGVFKRDPRNPVGDWNMIYVPYCTGDIHAGSRENVEVPNVPGKQQFVGYKNLGLFLKSFGPSFANNKQVLLTGSSAGGFGSLLNYDRFSEFFKPWNVEVLAVSDSGLPMRDPFMAPCLQKKWREYWGLNEAFPKECTDCFGNAGGLTEAAFKYYFGNKYKGRFLGGLITSVNDQIIRAFFAPGLSGTAGQPDDCTLDPGFNTISSALLLGQYPGDRYREGLMDVADNLVGKDQIGYYGIPGDGHMHLWRPHFFEKNGNTQSIAEWLADILAKKPTKQGDNLLHPK
jgi:hypothetical protein